MFRVVISSLMFVIVDASNRRLITQMNNIKEEIGFINNDISSLFQNIEKINKTVISNNQENPMVKGNQQTKIDSGKPNGIDSREIMALLEGFESEKRLNRQLLVRLETLETKVSDSDILLEEERKVSQQLQNSLQVLQTQVDDVNLALLSEQGTNQRLEKHITSLRLKQTWMNESNAAITKALESSDKKQLEISRELELLKESYSDTRKELESQTQMNRQQHIEIEAMKTKCNNEVVRHNSSIIKPEIIRPTPKHSTAAPLNWTTYSPEVTTDGVPHFHICTSTKRSGIYNYDIHFDSHITSKSVYCDADTDDGGWIVIMRRQDGSVNFNRTWDDYTNGFGDVNGEFWIGNKVLHQLTKTKPMELRVDMEYMYGDGNKVFAKYSVFKVGSEADKYVLTVSGYSGTAGDGLDGGRGNTHNGMKFTTFDQDNDRYNGNCARLYGGGWWYNSCGVSLLTYTLSTGTMNMRWYDDERWRYLKFAEMKIR